MANDLNSQVNTISSDKKQLKTSELLRETISSLKGNTVEIGDLVGQFKRRSFGGVLLILAILAMVPGISIFAGMAMLVPAYQLMMGFKAPVFPRSVERRVISVSALQRWGPNVIYWVEVLERLVKFRWPLLTNVSAQRLMGFTIMLLAVVVTIPFPFSNFPPSVAIICFALGLLERDGLMVIIGSIIGLVAFFIGAAIAFALITWISSFF